MRLPKSFEEGLVDVVHKARGNEVDVRVFVLQAAQELEGLLEPPPSPAPDD